QRVVVRFADDALGAVEDRLLEVVEQPPHVEVPPRRVGRQRPRAPDPYAAPGERPHAVHADRVEQFLLLLGELGLEGDRAAYDLVGGGLVHAAGGVVAGPDAGDVAAGRDELVGTGGRVED